MRPRSEAAGLFQRISPTHYVFTSALTPDAVRHALAEQLVSESWGGQFVPPWPPRYTGQVSRHRFELVRYGGRNRELRVIGEIQPHGQGSLIDVHMQPDPFLLVAAVGLGLGLVGVAVLLAHLNALWLLAVVIVLLVLVAGASYAREVRVACDFLSTVFTPPPSLPHGPQNAPLDVGGPSTPGSAHRPPPWRPTGRHAPMDRRTSAAPGNDFRDRAPMADRETERLPPQGH